MKIINIFLFLFLFSTSLLGATTDNNETEFTTGSNNRSTCLSECPPFKDGYFGRIANWNYDTGVTTCYVYHNQAPDKIVATVQEINTNCPKMLVNPNEIPNINSPSTRAKSHLNDTRNNVLNNYTTGGMSHYVNMPKYMIAGLTADDKIIDVSSSIASNEIVMNNSYTNQVNLNSTNDDSTTYMLARSKDALANSVTFVMDFLSSSDKILLSFKVSLFLFVVALSVILLLTQKATKKASQITDHDDIVEKIIFGVGSILVFFLTVNKIPTNDGQISQTGYQQIIRPLLYMGISTADKLTETATASILKYKFSQVGIVAQEDIKTMLDLQYKLNKKRIVYEAVYKECTDTYNVSALQSFSKNLANNYSFPQSEYIKMSSDSSITNVLNNSQLSFYSKTFLNNYETNINKTDLLSVSYCFSVEKLKTEIKSQLVDLNKKIETLSEGVVNERMISNITTTTDLVYKNVAEFGFVGVGNLATTTLAFNNFSLIKTDENSNLKIIEEKTKKTREATGYEVSSIVNGDNFFGEQLNSLIVQAPLFMLPMAGQIKEFVNSVFSPFSDNKKDKDDDGILTSIIKTFSMKGWVQKALSFATNLGVEYIVTVISLWILTNILAIAPLMAIIGASFLVLAFYFMSVEILYIAIPFASIFAFSTGNLEIIKSLIKNTFILAVKPVLIVVSVVMALFVYEMFHGLTDVIVNSMFEPLFALSNNLVDDSSYFSTGKLVGLGDASIFLFMKSGMLVLSSVITVFVCFYLVFNGANIILDLLGMRDGGFDVGGVIGDKVEGKGTVQKMNQIV